MKKGLLIAGLVLLGLVLTALAYLFLTTPKLLYHSNRIIDEVLTTELPEFVTGSTGYIENQGVKTWYESISPADSSKGAILLFMGISNDALGWPQAFLDRFVDGGYQVIRFDYRGTGLSDWVENYEEQPYSLTDLATDAKIIVDSLGIRKVHLLGISLGGMVAQEFAIHFPERTHSLTSLMSSGSFIDEELPPVSTKVVVELIKTSIRYSIIPSDKNTIKLHLASRVILRGDANYPIDVEGTSQQVLYNLKSRKGYNPKASNQHHEAVYRSSSRYERLKQLRMPVLVMHGLNDPFIPIEHSMKLASIIPNARTKWIENMGHDIPLNLIDTVYRELAAIMGSHQEEMADHPKGQ